MKKIFTIITVLFGVFFTYSSNLVDMEIFYDPFMREILGIKKFIYDESDNIVSIENYNEDNEIYARFEYKYEFNSALEVYEYANKIKVKYSKFLYNGATVIGKADYDSKNALVSNFKYIYGNDGNLKSILEYSKGGELVGKKEFIIEGDKVVEENQYDGENKLLINKKYLYKGDKINRIEFYLSTGRKIRVIERKYLNKNGMTSIFGYRNNFMDLR
ncbi:MAG TPA: hypothetical protein PLG34_07155 [Spirochaetota bacterium]|jgi:hypothetical protein|nr:MAG: hypothetical protein BWX91_01802 [Spirochaetes bacterium ADurb.Bin133]HNZ28095.1 hypothetical protein [Spirochaetota bacterium]HPY87744.1 hypothetical protein [Spirochaetota bacterium]HQB60576.1 hypothetical protein [Spirochaetota bacterium]